MPTLAAYDLDGTLLSYDSTQPPVINIPLFPSLPYHIAVVTNQGGIPFSLGEWNTDRYPTPQMFADRIHKVDAACIVYGVRLASVRVSVFHPRADRSLIEKAAREVYKAVGWNPERLIVYTSPGSRKPSPWMLYGCGAASFCGDSDEDEQAAAAAKIPFTRITRFHG